MACLPPWPVGRLEGPCAGLTNSRPLGPGPERSRPAGSAQSMRQDRERWAQPVAAIVRHSVAPPEVAAKARSADWRTRLRRQRAADNRKRIRPYSAEID